MGERRKKESHNSPVESVPVPLASMAYMHLYNWFFFSNICCTHIFIFCSLLSPCVQCVASDWSEVPSLALHLLHGYSSSILYISIGICVVWVYFVVEVVVNHLNHTRSSFRVWVYHLCRRIGVSFMIHAYIGGAGWVSKLDERWLNALAFWNCLPTVFRHIFSFAFCVLSNLKISYDGGVILRQVNFFKTITITNEQMKKVWALCCFSAEI